MSVVFIEDMLVFFTTIRLVAALKLIWWMHASISSSDCWTYYGI